MDDSLKEKIKKDKDKADLIEELFMEVVERNGYSFIEATEHQNWSEHWDVAILKDGNYERIDVKSMKEATTDGRTWVELQNVRGEIGWLYAEKLDAIAFEKEDRFDFIRRTDLISIVEEKIKNADIEDGGYTIYYEKEGIKDYRRYCRKNWGRDDRVIKVPLADIEHLIYKKIYK